MQLMLANPKSFEIVDFEKKEQLHVLLLEYCDVYKLPGDTLGCTDHVQYRIEIKGFKAYQAMDLEAFPVDDSERSKEDAGEGSCRTKWEPLGFSGGPCSEER